MSYTVKKKKKTYSCVDLFAGAGGFSLAAQLSGMTVKLAIEYDKHAAHTYRNNISKNQAVSPILIDTLIGMT